MRSEHAGKEIVCRVRVTRSHRTEGKLFRKFDPLASRHLIYKIFNIVNEQVSARKSSRAKIVHNIVEQPLAGVVENLSVTRNIIGLKVSVLPMAAQERWERS